MGCVEDFLTQNAVKRFVSDRMTSYRRDIAATYREGLRLEQAGKDAIASHQEAGLRALLAAALRAPYHARLLGNLGVSPESFRLSDLTKLPFLTKDLLRAHGHEMRMPGATGVRENYSGGSTGIPVRFYQDYHYRVGMSAATRRANALAGAFPGARVAKLWGAPQDRRKIEGLHGRLRLWLLNQRYYDTFDMSVERMEAYHRDMELFQPDIIQAYASSVYLLAKFLKERNIRPSYPRTAIITAAEKLFPHMRREIEEVFPVRVFDRYGSREVAAIAAECEAHEGLHIQESAYIVETVDPATGEAVEGKPGEIAVTVLANYAMPFLRYRIGDRGILTRTPCSCGRTFSRLLEIVGRTTDNFLMPDGRIVHGEYFTHLFYGRDGIRQFQFEQVSRDDFTLRLVPASGYSSDLRRHIEAEIRDAIGEAPTLRVEIRDEIPKTPSGKYRFTLSRVEPEELVRKGER